MEFGPFGVGQQPWIDFFEPKIVLFYKTVLQLEIVWMSQNSKFVFQKNMSQGGKLYTWSPALCLQLAVNFRSCPIFFLLHLAVAFWILGYVCVIWSLGKWYVPLLIFPPPPLNTGDASWIFLVNVQFHVWVPEESALYEIQNWLLFSIINEC